MSLAGGKEDGMRDTSNTVIGILVGALAGGLVWVVAVGVVLVIGGWL